MTTVEEQFSVSCTPGEAISPGNASENDPPAVTMEIQSDAHARLSL